MKHTYNVHIQLFGLLQGTLQHQLSDPRLSIFLQFLMLPRASLPYSSSTCKTMQLYTQNQSSLLPRRKAGTEHRLPTNISRILQHWSF